MVPLPDLSASQNELILRHLPLVRKIAGFMFSQRSFDGVPFEEYVQLGSEGLIQAVRRYDPVHGAKFETYASHRIKGAIVSGLEKATEVNQQVATLRRMQQERLDSLMGRDEPATLSPDSTQSAFDRLVEVSVGLAVAFMLDDTNLYHEGEATCWDDGASNMAFKQLKTRLGTALESLNHGERTVLEQHYFQHDSFELIAQRMAVSRSRVSQLHRSALQHLRALLTVRHLGDLLG